MPNSGKEKSDIEDDKSVNSNKSKKSLRISEESNKYDEPKKTKLRPRSRSASSKSTNKTNNSTKKNQKPEWNRYIWHLNDKQRNQLMELPVIPDSVKETNKTILKERAKSAKELRESEPKTKEMLKSIIKSPDNQTAPTTRSINSTRSKKSSTPESDDSRKIQFRPIRGTRVQDLNNFDYKYSLANKDNDQMNVSTTYRNLVRSMRANLDHYNRCRQLHKSFLYEHQDVLNPPPYRMIVSSKACRRNNYLNHFYDGDTMTGNHR